MWGRRGLLWKSMSHEKIISRNEMHPYPRAFPEIIGETAFVLNVETYVISSDITKFTWEFR